MRLILNGFEGLATSYIRTSDITLQCLFLTDTGSPLSLASPAVATLEFFTTSSRIDIAPIIYTVTSTVGPDAQGFGTVVIEDTDTNPVRGTTYYIWGRWKSGAGTGAGTTVLIGNTPSTMVIR